jgi:hypothetical protein
MKVLSGVLVCALTLSFAGVAQTKYTGVKQCAACHKSGKGGTSYAVWEKSAHAKAYTTLLGEESKKIAKEKGLTTAPHESEACLKCHVTGGGTAKNLDASFKKEEGVTCEVCHGAASGYKVIHANPANKEKAAAAGLSKGVKDSKECEVCHNAESPTFKGFKFDEMWAKIEHATKK